MATFDRLALARRNYMDAQIDANSRYAAEARNAYELWGNAAADARLLRTQVAPEVVAEHNAILTAAGQKLKAELAVPLAEVQAAVAEARANGTFHWLVAWGVLEPEPEPVAVEPVDDDDEGEGWLDPWEL